MSETTRFMMSLSIDIMDGRNRVDAIKKQAFSTCHNKRWAGLLEMMALSQVIGHTIFSVYPNCAPGIRPVLHGPITPRMVKQHSTGNACYIMWTRDGALDNNGVFQPNHFVPLIASSAQLDESPVTYANITKHGKKDPATALKGKDGKTVEPTVSKKSTPSVCSQPRTLTDSTSTFKANNKKTVEQTAKVPSSSSVPKQPQTTTESTSLLKGEDRQAVQPNVQPTVQWPSTFTASNETQTTTESTRQFKGKDRQTVEPTAKRPSTSSVSKQPKTAMESTSPYKGKGRQAEEPTATGPPTFSLSKQPQTTTESTNPFKGKDQQMVEQSASRASTPSVSNETIMETDSSSRRSGKNLQAVEITASRNSTLLLFKQRSAKVESAPSFKRKEQQMESTESRPSSSSLSVSMQHLIKPSSRYARRKFSIGKKTPSLSASLCKHLGKRQSTSPLKGNGRKTVEPTATGQLTFSVEHLIKRDKNVDGFKENSLKRKREERESEKNKRPPKAFFDESNVSAEHRTKEQNYTRLGLTRLPLYAGHDWYFERGRNESKNRARSASRTASVVQTDDEGTILGTYRSKVSGTLEENLKALDEKADTANTLEEKYRLLAVRAVGKHLNCQFPIIPTQEAGRIYCRTSTESVERADDADDGVVKRRKSIEIYEALSKHLNILQIYIRGTAFIMENRSSPLLDIVNNFKTILEGFNSRTQLNAHIENQIGECYKTALAYLDTKRDRDTIKFLLTQITSISFMAKLQGTSNKHSLQNCALTLPGKLQKFEAVMQELTEKKNLAELLPNEKRGLIRRQRDLIKERELRHRFKSPRITGRKLKIEEFPDIPAILEYEFGEGNRIKRGGGGLESHPKLTNEILYRAADNTTNMIDARQALLSLAPEDFSISLSSCYNYTQNFRKGTLQAKRHHEGRGINACISLHKAPDTAPIKDFVINVHWSAANVNAILDEAAQNPCETFVDSYDAKQVVRPADRHNTKTWRVCEYEDHTYDQSRNNAITPMSHLFLETKETHRESRFSRQLFPNVADVLLGSSERQETVIHQKRTGKAITVLRLSYYENETVFRSINELLYLMTLPQLDKYFRDPNTGKLKPHFVFVVDNGVDMPRSPLVQMLLVRLQRYLGINKITQVSFAEYHSKRNPVERVHAPEEKELEKHGPFKKVAQETNTAEHRQAMEEMADEVREVFSHARFGGEPILCVRGPIGKENFIFNDEDDLHSFLALTEQRKLESPLTYKARCSTYSKELNITWGINEKFEGEYAEDYQLLTNDTGSPVITAWRDKYTTVVFDNSSSFQYYNLQPVPDYVRWYLSGGEMHYLPYEQRRDLADGPWKTIPELFLPSRILDLVFLCLRNLPSYAMRSVSILSWCSILDVEKQLKKKAEDMQRDFDDSVEQHQWRQHPLYKEKRETLEAKCKEKGVECNGAKHLLVKRIVSVDPKSSPPVVLGYSGDITTIPCAAKEIAKLPLCRLKQILHFHNIPTQGNKDQLVLRVLAVRTGTTHLLFTREFEALGDLIKASKFAIGEQIKVNAIVGDVVYRERTFQRDTMPSLKETRPRDGASVSNQDRKETVTPVPDGISLRNLTTVFDEIESLIKTTKQVNNEKSDPDNIEAITTPGTRVSVLWTEKDAMLGWGAGWYTAVVRSYNRLSGDITIEYSSEQGKRYVLNVKESVDKGILKLLKVSCDSNLYDEVTEIGARIQVHWGKDDIKGTDWKTGWYFAEVQGFDPDEDTISIVYEKEPGRVYEECVTVAISKGEIKLIKSVF